MVSLMDSKHDGMVYLNDVLEDSEVEDMNQTLTEMDGVEGYASAT